jgi:hypothetical protein
VGQFQGQIKQATNEGARNRSETCIFQQRTIPPPLSLSLNSSRNFLVTLAMLLSPCLPLPLQIKWISNGNGVNDAQMMVMRALHLLGDFREKL